MFVEEKGGDGRTEEMTRKVHATSGETPRERAKDTTHKVRAVSAEREGMERTEDTTSAGKQALVER